MKDMMLLKSRIPIFVTNVPSGMLQCANNGCEYWHRVLDLKTLFKNMGEMGEEFFGVVVTCWQV